MLHQWKDPSGNLTQQEVEVFFPLIAAVEQCSELKWQTLLTLCLSKVGEKNALQAFETHCSVELRNPVPALQLQLNFRADWMFPFSLVTAAPISSLMKVHRCSTVPGSVGTACVRLCVVCTTGKFCACILVCVCVCVSFHLPKATATRHVGPPSRAKTTWTVFWTNVTVLRLILPSISEVS